MAQTEVILEPVFAPAAAGGARLRAAEIRGRRIAQLKRRHLTMLWLSLAIIAASFALQTEGSDRVSLAGWPGLTLPGMCGSRALFGIDCPGCGLTRSFVALAGRDLAGSFAFHRLGWLLAAAVLLQIPYRMFALGELRTRVPTRRWPEWFGHALIAALIFNWLLKAVAGGL